MKYKILIIRQYQKLIFLTVLLFSTIFYSKAQEHPEYGFYFNFPIGTKFSYVSETGAGDVSSFYNVIVAEKDNTLIFSSFTTVNKESIVTNSVMIYRNDTIFMPFNLNSNKCAAEFKHGKIWYLPYPLNAKIGQYFPDIETDYFLYQRSYKSANKLCMIKRKVESRETIKNQAGEFDCYVLTYNDNAKNLIKLWICEKLGIVKSQSYNKNGQLIGKMQLMSINKI